jgi:glucose-1-phosphate thymidylyltransferase
MKIVVPMAGRGSRLRPHTLTVPKPLVKVAGKPIVERLVEDLARLCQEPLEEIAFVVGDFGAEVEAQLLGIAARLGAKGRICRQERPLGTAHAVLCAAEALDGPVIVAFADTLFKADFHIDPALDGMIWVQQVEDPSRFGVVKYDAEGFITDFVEKPQQFVSDRAIIGIYYFRDGAYLRQELQRLIDEQVVVKGEYQLTDALENMKQQGTRFAIGTVLEWLDCGNKDATVDSNRRYLGFLPADELISPEAQVVNSAIIPPVYLAPGARIENSVVGPYVSVGRNSTIRDSVVRDSIVQDDTVMSSALVEHSMVGSHAAYYGRAKDLSIGDYTVIKE